MPSSKPAPRRASNTGRPAGSGRPRSGGSSRQSSSGRPASGGYQGRPSRDGGERRSERGGTRPARPSDDRRSSYSAREGSERPYRRFDREEDDRRGEARRPRPQSAGRGGSSRDGGERRSERGGTRPARPSDDRRSSYSARPAREGRSSERPGRPAREGRSSERPGRPARPGARPPRDGEYKDRRPQLPPRDRYVSKRDAAAERSGGRVARPRPSYRDRELTPEELERKKAAEFGKSQGWGGVARKGGASIKSTGQAMEQTPSAGRTPDPLSEWVEEVRPERPTKTTKSKPKAKYQLPTDIAADVRKAFIGTAYMREKMVITLTKAAEAYDRKRYEEALRLGRIVSDAAPGVAPVRELTGLAAYRADRWNMAKIHLRTHFAITGDPEHLPLVMDCDRANRRYRAVAKTFDEITESEPTAEVLTEARIVMAASLADQRLFTEAIELLTKAGGTRILRNPSYRHVRLWYALADVYDRAGDTASARELFARVVLAEPDAYDAKDRLAELGSVAPRKNRKRRTTPVSKKKID
jgi:Tetratricopeptide repeat